jgi:signal transduction histidine kinase
VCASDLHSLVDHSRRLVALGRLSSGVGHEVKNAANTITIYLALLEEKLRLAAEAAGGGPALESALGNVRVIGDEVKRLDKVMQGFLKFNRPEELKLEPISVSSLVDDVVRTIGPECDAAGVKIVADLLGGLPDINGDAEMLKQALLNLALNARQAMPHGGTLRIAAATARGRRLEIAVEDTGVGIKPSDLGKIFNLYFTTREGGSGLGLSMVYRTVQLHEGEIEVQSSEGRGTTFRILLPQAS